MFSVGHDISQDSQISFSDVVSSLIIDLSWWACVAICVRNYSVMCSGHIILNIHVPKGYGCCFHMLLCITKKQMLRRSSKYCSGTATRRVLCGDMSDRFAEWLPQSACPMGNRFADLGHWFPKDTMDVLFLVVEKMDEWQGREAICIQCFNWKISCAYDGKICSPKLY